MKRFLGLSFSEQEILQNSTLDSSSEEHSFSGISLGASYEVAIECLFGGRVFKCGRQAILSCKPFFIMRDSNALIFLNLNIFMY